MDIINKIDKMITDTIAVGDVESNLAQGSVDVVGGECPKGQQWCTKTKKCVPIGSGDGEGPRKKRISDSSVVGGSYISSISNIAGSGQTRVGGEKDKEIETIKRKVPGLITRFSKLLGAYTVDEK